MSYFFQVFYHSDSKLTNKCRIKMYTFVIAGNEQMQIKRMYKKFLSSSVPECGIMNVNCILCNWKFSFCSVGKSGFNIRSNQQVYLFLHVYVVICVCMHLWMCNGMCAYNCVYMGNVGCLFSVVLYLIIGAGFLNSAQITIIWQV